MVSPLFLVGSWVNYSLCELNRWFTSWWSPEASQMSECCLVPFPSLCPRRDFSSWCFPRAVCHFVHVFFLCRCCWKEKNKINNPNPRGDRGPALARSPGNGNSDSVYIFFLFLHFSRRSGVDPFPPLLRGTLVSFQHSCTGNPTSSETNSYRIFPALRYLFVRVSGHNTHRGSAWGSQAAQKTPAMCQILLLCLRNSPATG